MISTSWLTSLDCESTLEHVNPNRNGRDVQGKLDSSTSRARCLWRLHNTLLRIENATSEFLLESLEARRVSRCVRVYIPDVAVTEVATTIPLCPPNGRRKM